MHATGELVLCVDSDSKINGDGLKYAVRHFEDPTVAAVGGHVHLAGTDKTILRMQQIEYLIGLNFPRRTLSLFGAVPVVPGPAGLFRRDVLLRMGAYLESKTNFAEDAELTIRLLSKGYLIHSDEDLIAETEGPENITALLRQRYRWTRGMAQAVRIHRHALRKSGLFRGRFLSSYLTMESSILPIFNFGLILFFLSSFFWTGVTGFFGAYLAYNALIDICRLFLATHHDVRLWRWIPQAFLVMPFYSFLLQTWSVLSLIDEWRNEEMTWDKLDRTGQIRSAAA
jgi:cellulose synthase/poly-beta-1,6-N-acetylglucosamine synthase-like glycosyltransferase